jgi:hypothetical protein
LSWNKDTVKDDAILTFLNCLAEEPPKSSESLFDHHRFDATTRIQQNTSQLNKTQDYQNGKQIILHIKNRKQL